MQNVAAGATATVHRVIPNVKVQRSGGALALAEQLQIDELVECFPDVYNDGGCKGTEIRA
jgi:hypothetical protein